MIFSIWVEKNPFVIFICLVLVFASLSCGCTQESGVYPQIVKSPQTIVFNDSLGNLVELPRAATRIVAGNSAVAEMLVTIGAGDRIVGVTDSVMNRREIMERISPSVVSIGSVDTPDLETIITLKPDVLLLYGPSSGHQAKNLEKILASNISVITLDCYKLEGVSNDAYALGVLTNNSEGAGKYIQFNQKYMQLVQSRIANLTPDEIPDVYAESGTDYTVLNRATGIGQILGALNARNIYGNSTAYEFPKFNPEWVLEKNPDIILKSGESTTGTNLSEIHSRIINRTGYDQIQVVQSHRVFVYNTEIIGRPRVVIGLIYIAKVLYPDRFADINPASIEEEYAREFSFGSDKTERLYPPISSLNSGLIIHENDTVRNSAV